jgi:tetratricopeptide (TPR) repeat protein
VERAENMRYGMDGRVGKYSEIECYLEALKRDPEYAEAWCGLGSEITGMGASEDTDKELVGMDLFKDEPKITDDKRLHYAHINAAKFCFDKAIEIEPKYVDAWYGKGSWCLEWRPPDLKEGIECFLEVTKLDPKHKTAWFDLANAYSSYTSEYAKAVKCYDEAIALSPDNLHVVYAKKAELLSEYVDKRGLSSSVADYDLKKKHSSGKDALMCYDKALEIKPKYGYASYKKGRLLERLSKYEEALECFENYSYEESKDVWNSNQLHKQALRDKLKPNEDGSTESFEIYCRVLGDFFKDDKLSEVEYARKRLNENILQHIHKLANHIDENDFYDRGEWLQKIGREKEALELYDKHVEKSLEKGDLYEAGFANNTKAEYYGRIGRSKDEFDCYEKTIQFFEKSTENFDEDAAYHFASAYSNNAKIFKSSGNMDKAIEYIDHAIKLEQEYAEDDPVWWWKTKVSWLPDEEAIKFLDEEIKVWQNSSYRDEEFRNWFIENMTLSKNELLKKLAK